MSSSVLIEILSVIESFGEEVMETGLKYWWLR